MDFKDIVFRSHLEDGEQIFAVAHRSKFVFLRASWKTFFFGVFLPVLFYLIFPYFILISIAWLIGGVVGMLYHALDWYFDAFLLTNMGVIDIESNGLFERSSNRIEYHMIEGISYSIKGFWATILNFGDVIVDKMGSQTFVKLQDASNPKRIEKKLMEFQERFVNEKSFRDHQMLKEMLSNMIAYHVQGNKIEVPKNIKK